MSAGETGMQQGLMQDAKSAYAQALPCLPESGVTKRD
jgi:cytochrome c-type biogenesis protein CcmH/NrfG